MLTYLVNLTSMIGFLEQTLSFIWSDELPQQLMNMNCLFMANPGDVEAP